MSKEHVCNKLDFDTLFEMRFVKKKNNICRTCYRMTPENVRSKLFEYEIYLIIMNRRAQKAFETLKLNSFDKKLTEYTFDDYVQIGRKILKSELTQPEVQQMTDMHDIFVFGQEKKDFKFCFPNQSG
jgi:hypothetical protein